MKVMTLEQLPGLLREKGRVVGAWSRFELSGEVPPPLDYVELAELLGAAAEVIPEQKWLDRLRGMVRAYDFAVHAFARGVQADPELMSRLDPGETAAADARNLVELLGDVQRAIADREQLECLAGLVWRFIEHKPLNVADFEEEQSVYDDAEKALIDFDLVGIAKARAEGNR